MPASPFSQLPTAQNAITAERTILGTLQYMAPEQVEGREFDARTDIFASALSPCAARDVINLRATAWCRLCSL